MKDIKMYIKESLKNEKKSYEELTEFFPEEILTYIESRLENKQDRYDAAMAYDLGFFISNDTYTDPSELIQR